ncbi:MAG: hypothetical protein ACLQRH_00790 [Acidimicrobiales bacterium]
MTLMGYALLVAGAMALSAWQAQLTRDSSAAHWIVALVIVAATVVAIVIGRGRQRQTARAWVAGSVRAIRAWRSQSVGAVVSAIVWTVLIVGVLAWDLASFIVHSPRVPTLSYFIGHVTRYEVGRGLLFALWLGVGSYLVSAWRRKAPH